MEQACLLTLSKPIIVYSPHALNLLCHVVIGCCGGTPDVETKLLVLPEQQTAPCKRMNWTCFEAVAARLSRCPIYFWTCHLICLQSFLQSLLFPLVVKVLKLNSAGASVSLSLFSCLIAVIMLWFVMEVITFSWSSTKFVFSVCQRSRSG